MTPVILPKMGLTMEDAKVVKWHKKEGESLRIGEALLEIETEKANAEIESPANGFLKKIVVNEGESLPVESVLAYVAESEAELAAELALPSDSTQPTHSRTKSLVCQGEVSSEGSSCGALEAAQNVSGEIRAAPAARKLARDLRVDLTHVRGSGPNGRILPEDVRKYSTHQPNAEPNRNWEGRRSLRSHLMRSVQSIPHINIAREICAEHLADFKKQNESLTYTDIILKVFGQSLTGFPVFKTSIMDEKVFSADSNNIGLIVEAGESIRIPVLRGVDQKTIHQISRENKELTRKARENLLTHDEVQGATVSVTNLGMYGVDYFTAIIPYGQCGILTVGRIKGMAEGREREQRTLSLWLNLVVDHRLIDGATAARLLDRMAGYLETRSLFVLLAEQGA
jgi:pyruvate dehydrogenase E2 component (dihydrolipoamide acetyltransferase)